MPRFLVHCLSLPTSPEGLQERGSGPVVALGKVLGQNGNVVSSQPQA